MAIYVEKSTLQGFKPTVIADLIAMNPLYRPGPKIPDSLAKYTKDSLACRLIRLSS